MKRLNPFIIAAALSLTSLSAGASLPAEPSSPSAAAITQAERAIAQHGYSGERLLALGRAQLEAGRIGPAVASFQRGLVLEPRSPELRDALAKTQAEAGIARQEQTLPERFVYALSLREWANLGLLALLVLSMTVLARAFTKLAKGPIRAVTALALAAFAASAGAFMIGERELTRSATLQNSAIARQSPFADAEATFTLRAGESVRMLQRHGNYTYVQREPGAAGWVANRTLIPLAADPLSPT
jgi:hypothetical protein